MGRPISIEDRVEEKEAVDLVEEDRVWKLSWRMHLQKLGISNRIYMHLASCVLYKLQIYQRGDEQSNPLFRNSRQAWGHTPCEQKK